MKTKNMPKKILSQISCKGKKLCKTHKYCIAIILVLVLAFVATAFMYPGFLRTRGQGNDFVQNDWHNGPGQTGLAADLTKFDSSTNIDYSTIGQLKLNQTLEAWQSGGVRTTESPLSGTAPRSVASGTGIITAFIDTSSPNTVRVQKIDANGNRMWPSIGTKDGVMIDQSADIGASQVLKIVSDGADGAIVVWEKNSLLYAQKIDVSGASQWPLPLTPAPVQISSLNCDTTNGSYDYFDIVFDNANGVDIAFKKGNSTDIQGQRILSDGTLSWGVDGKLIKHRKAPVFYISLATDVGHGFYFGYLAGSEWNIDLVDGDGISPAWSRLSDRFLFFSFVDPSSSPVIISDGNDRGVVTSWVSGGNIYIQRIDSSGAQLWPNSVTPAPIQITNSADTDANPQIALLDSGSIGITWVWTLNGGGETDKNIYLQKINLSDGSRFNNNWPDGGRALLSTNGRNIKPVIAQDGAGGAYVFWVDIFQQSGVFGLMGQRIDGDNSIHDGWAADGTVFGTLSSNGTYFINTGSANIPFASFVNDSDFVYAQKIDTLISSPGTLVSSIFDAGEQVNWGNLNWNASIPDTSTITLETRTEISPASDVAIGGTATATSWCGIPDPEDPRILDCGFEAPPERAIDGGTGHSMFSDDWVTGTGGPTDFTGNPQDLVVNLGQQSKTINSIKLDSNTNESGVMAPAAFTIDTSPTGDNGSWTLQVTENGNLNSEAYQTYELTGTYEYTFASPVPDTKFVRLHITGGKAMDDGSFAVAVAEFYIYEGGWSPWSSTIHPGSGVSPADSAYFHYNGLIENVDGSTITNRQPTFNFSISDPTGSDNNGQYAIVITKDAPLGEGPDPNSNVVMAYFDDLPNAFPANLSFTVGQIYSGSGPGYMPLPIGEGDSLEPGHNYYVTIGFVSNTSGQLSNTISCWTSPNPSFVLTKLTGTSGSIDLSSLPVGQYFQYKITMTSDGADNPTLIGGSDSLKISYTPVPVPPPPPSSENPSPGFIPTPSSITVPINSELLIAQTDDHSVKVETNPSFDTKYNGSDLHLESSDYIPGSLGSFKLTNVSGTPLKQFTVSVSSDSKPSFTDPITITFSTLIPENTDLDDLVLYHDVLHNDFASGVFQYVNGDHGVTITMDPTIPNLVHFTFSTTTLSNFILAKASTEPTPTSAQICTNTLDEVQITPIPPFPEEWGQGYPKGRAQWALDHRRNIYQLYLDYLGRAPCAVEVNWQMTHDSDIYNIRFNMITSEEYMDKQGGR